MEDNHNDNFGALSYNNAISRVLFGVINVFCYIEYLPMNAPSRKIRLIGTAMYRIFVTMYIMVRNFPYELPRFTFCYKQKVLVFKSDALKDQIQFIMNVTFFSYSPLNSRCFAVCFRWHQGDIDRCLPECERLNVTSCSQVRGKPPKFTFQFFYELLNFI